MKSTISKLMLAIVCVSSVAKADVFEERRSLSVRKTYQSQEQQYWNMLYKMNLISVKAVRVFAAGHSGLATEPVCEYVTAKCDHGFCAGDINSMEVPTLPLSQVQANAGYYLVSCKMELKNGLACKTDFNNQDQSALQATCYDSRGNEKEFKISKSSVSK